MKKTLISTIFTAIAALSLNAQIVNIPDANFKAYLLADPNINTNADTEIQVSEAQAFTGISASITINSDLGISDLTGIEAFTGLSQLIIRNNSITTLNLSNNSALLFLFCEGNQLTSIDVSNCPLLQDFWCNNNQLTSINLTNNSALVTFFCSGNQLSNLNLSNKTSLTQVLCNHNELTSLNVNNCTSLINLDCQKNYLTSLDISSNLALNKLDCNRNLLTNLNLSVNISLNEFNCWTNELTILNVANGNNSNFVLFTAHNNPNLACIQVDDASYSTSNWTSVDTTATFSENCSTGTGIDNLSASKNSIDLYPNPTSNYINFSVQANAQLINLNGQIVLDQKNVNSLDVSELKSGIYFILLSDSNGAIIQRSKIVKE
jgi:hypothetical protein